MGKRVQHALLLLAAAILCGCAHKTLVALVPDPDGKTGSITVSNEAGSVAIHAPYQATTVAGGNERPSSPEPITPEILRETFGEALSVQPERPLHFLIDFSEETTPTWASLEHIPNIIAAIRARHSVYISVIGHTDTIASRDYNMELSYRRAMAVEGLLVGQGVDPHTIWTSWYGEEHLLVPTGDEVREPRNRRVEVIVR